MNPSNPHPGTHREVISSLPMPAASAFVVYRGARRGLEIVEIPGSVNLVYLCPKTPYRPKIAKNISI